jgi:hypothetical protein
MIDQCRKSKQSFGQELRTEPVCLIKTREPRNRLVYKLLKLFYLQVVENHAFVYLYKNGLTGFFCNRT